MPVSGVMPKVTKIGIAETRNPRLARCPIFAADNAEKTSTQMTQMTQIKQISTDRAILSEQSIKYGQEPHRHKEAPRFIARIATCPQLNPVQ